jgi:GTP-binding protein HflX
MSIEQKQLKERAILVGISTSKSRGRLALEHLEELKRLAETAGAEVTETFMQNLQTYNPSTLIGEGKVEEIRQALESSGTKMLVFDEDLSGSQVRNLESRLPGIKVLDRTGLILDIFAKHAVTAESRLMVEIAQLQYIMPRLTRAWTHLCRQHNGGIGTKGPGETQLETDRRLIRNRIRDLKKKLQKIENARDRLAVKRYDTFHVGIVGYTNAGKSTLTNRLTGANVYVENKLFATLDSTTRKLYLGNDISIILSDTVGFIRKLPHHLVETFRSTLGIATHADCILEVVDASAPDYAEHLEVTQKVLSSIVEESIPRILAFNKSETATKERREELKANYPDAIQISALENIGMEALRLKLIELHNTWAKKRNIQKVEEIKNAEGWSNEKTLEENR